MKRRDFLQTTCAAIALTATTAWTQKTPTYPQNYYKFHTAPASFVEFGLSPDDEKRAAELHKSLYVFDGETEVGYYSGLYDNILKGGGAGVGGSFTVGAFGIDNAHGLTSDIQIRWSDWWARETLDRDLGFIERQLVDHGDKIMLCTSAADLDEAATLGRIGMMLDVQNTAFIGNDETVLDEYVGRGLRRVQLTYNRTVPAGTGCMEPRDGGLTLFGRDVVARLNDLNMIVDTGHCSPNTMMDAIDVSTKPIACSHAGLRSSVPANPRSHPDEALKKLADNGGVFGVVSFPRALVPSDRCTVADFVDNIDKAVNLMGVDHVGFAMDHVMSLSLQEILTAPEWPREAAEQVGVGVWPWSDGHLGLENHTGYPNLTRGLVAKGYSDEDIRKVMGGNWIRLTRDVVG